MSYEPQVTQQATASGTITSAELPDGRTLELEITHEPVVLDLEAVAAPVILKQYRLDGQPISVDEGERLATEAIEQARADRAGLGETP